MSEVLGMKDAYREAYDYYETEKNLCPVENWGKYRYAISDEIMSMFDTGDKAGGEYVVDEETKEFIREYFKKDEKISVDELLREWKNKLK